MTKTAILSALIVSLLAVGCGPSSSGSGDSGDSAPTGAGKMSGTIEEAAFKGGFGIDFYDQAAKEFAAKNPGVTVKVWGDPRVWEELRPRLLSGSPPDLMFPGWGMDHWALADEGQILELDKAMASPAAEGSGTWGDTFEPSILKLGQENGKQYVLPYYFNVEGWWYDPNVFAQHGWTPPKTFGDLIALCPKIKAAGMAPLTFQGKYPYYMITDILMPWIQSIGGKSVTDDIFTLKPGAWKSPAVLQAASMIKQLSDQGDFLKGSVGLSHTESQTAFLQGHAAMIPCGTWLDSEMSKVMPKGVKIKYMLPPTVDGGKGDPTAVIIDIEPWMFPSKAKNPDGAIALFKYMTSLSEAKKFVEQKGSLMSIKGSDQAKLPDTLVEPSKVFHNSKTVWSYQYRYWYPKAETEVENALTALLTGEATPEQFCDRAEAASEAVRNDKSTTKHTL